MSDPNTAMQSTALTRKSFLRTSRFYWLLLTGLYLCFVVTMLVFVPVDVASAPSAAAFADFMASLVPMLDQIRKIPGYHPYLRFYYSVLWALFPVACWFGWQINKYDSSFIGRNYESKSLFGKILLLIGLPVLVLTAFIWPVRDGLNHIWQDYQAVSNVFEVAWFGLMTIVVAGLISGALIRTLIFIHILGLSYSTEEDHRG